MKVLLTGAHLTPAIAVIKELKKETDIHIVYVGRRTTMEGDRTESIESKIIPSLGIKFIPIIAGRLQRGFSVYSITSLLKIPIGFIQALYIVLSEKPNVVLSFGGYVSVPVTLAAWLFSIPIIIHEQTLVTGLANKISAFFADKVALSFSDGLSQKKAFLSGNPIRPEVTSPLKTVDSKYKEIFNNAKKNKMPVVYITGGNQGSHVINQAVEQALDKLLNMAFIIHQTGDSKFKDYDRLKLLQNERYIVERWIGEEIGYILSRIDLVVSRAGANTLTELSFWGKPALVVPLPHLHQDEQNKNAKFFAQLGLVTILPQPKLSPESLYKQISEMIKNLEIFKRRSKDARVVVIPDASKRIALETVLLAKKQNKF